jgi:hypothetical protein
MDNKCFYRFFYVFFRHFQFGFSIIMFDIFPHDYNLEMT